MPVILATQEAEIRRVAVRSQPWANSLRESFSKILPHACKKKAGGVAQGVGPELKSQYLKKKANLKRLHPCHSSSMPLRKGKGVKNIRDFQGVNGGTQRISRH
jgi:hypothetical protein